MTEDKDLIWITEAQVVYKRSRTWLEKQMEDGKLSRVLLPGTARVYLRRSELDKLLGKPDDNN
jgi:hypothetical protein